MRRLKRFIGLALAVVMAFSLATGVWATEPLSTGEDADSAAVLTADTTPDGDTSPADEDENGDGDESAFDPEEENSPADEDPPDNTGTPDTTGTADALDSPDTADTQDVLDSPDTTDTRDDLPLDSTEEEDFVGPQVSEDLQAELLETSGSCGTDVNWDFNAGTLTISGTGAMYTYTKAANVPWNGQISMIFEVIVDEGVTTIGANSFSGCNQIEKVTIPSTVTAIEYYAFYGCTKISSIELPDRVTFIGESAFSGCTGLQSISLGRSLQTIYKNAFLNCSLLTSLTFPGTLTALNNDGASTTYGPFKGCSKLKSVTFESGITSVSAYAFRGCESLTSVNLPDTITSIGNYAFDGCNLDKLPLPSSVTSIGEHAFYGNSNAKGVLQLDGLTSIGTYAFYGCEQLTAVTIPAAITAIPNYAFACCTGLTTLTLNEGLATIGGGAFYQCTSLETVTIPSTVTAINVVSYSYNNYWGAFEGCTGMKTLTILDSDGSTALTIARDSFYGCSSLQSATISWNTKSIGANAFYECSALTSLTFKRGLGAIEESAFAFCTSLPSVSIPGTVTSIAAYAFNGCTGLKTLELNNGIATINGGAFYDCTSLQTVTIPGSVTLLNYVQYSYNNYWGAFENCTALETVVMEDGAGEMSISREVFNNCTNLKSVKISGHVKYIGQDAFLNCTSLTDLTLEDGVETIYDSAFSGCSSLPAVSIPGSVTSIGSYAFCNCTSLKTLDLNEGLVTICGGAFYNCTSLQDVKIPGSVTLLDCIQYSYNNYWGAFENCTALENVIFADGEDSLSISREVFNNCTSLKSVKISGHVKYIGQNAFLNCTSLTDLTLEDGVETIYDSAFSGCSSLPAVSIPGSVASIGSYAFCNCTSLKTLELNEGLTSISGGAFYNCSSLQAVKIPGSVTLLDCIQYSYNNYWGAFENCTALETVVFADGENPLSVSREAFNNCKSLRSAEISGRVNYIGQDAFLNCSSLTDLTLEDGLETVYDSAFSGCSSLLSVSLPSTVKTVGNYAFYGCTAMINLELNDGLTSIGGAAFYNCISLKNVDIPDSVTSMSTVEPSYHNYLGPFQGCTGLTYAAVGTGLTTITPYAFSGCTSLQKVAIPAEVTSVGNCAFQNCSAIDTVYYGASISDWEVINFNSGNEYLTGAANILYYGYDNAPAVNPVSVVHVTDIALSGADLAAGVLTMELGTTSTLVPVITPDNASSKAVLWKSSNPSVASVDADGTVSALVPGETTITATALQGGLSADCTVKVVRAVGAVEAISFTRVTMTLVPGGTDTLQVTVLPVNATVRTLTWTSSNTAIAEVDENGTVTGIKSGGSAVITATNADRTVSASCTVSVIDPGTLSSIKLANTPTSVVQGRTPDTSKMEVIAVYSKGYNAKVADYTVEVDTSTSGETTATVNYQGKTATFTITVVPKSVTGIAITRLPNKTVYSVGDAFDGAGMEVTASYNDGTTGLVEEYTVTGYNSHSVGKQELVVTCEGRTRTLIIEVVNSEAIQPVAAPVVAVENISSGKQITLSTTTEGAVIYYTIDDSTPDRNSQQYTTPFSIDETTTVKAYAVMPEDAAAVPDSSITAVSVPVSQVETPTASLTGAVVTLTTGTYDATIYYTTDGSDPVTNGEAYTGGIQITEKTTVRAVATRSGCAISGEFKGDYTPPEAPPAITIGSVNASPGRTVSIPVFSGIELATGFTATITYPEALAFVSASSTVSVSNNETLRELIISRTDAVSAGEVCTLTFLVSSNASSAAGALEVGCTVTNPTDVTAAGGTITIAAAKSVEASAVLTSSEGENITKDTVSSSENVTASIFIDSSEINEAEETSETDEITTITVVLAIYDDRGRYVSSNITEVNTADLYNVFTRLINIPRNVNVGSIKMMVLSNLTGGMKPLSAPNSFF